MKRSQMIVMMERIYAIRHVMVETGHITLQQFMDEMLSSMEEVGILPPTLNKTSIFYDRQNGTHEICVNEWEPE
jgi:hypothetical protein